MTLSDGKLAEWESDLETGYTTPERARVLIEEVRRLRDTLAFVKINLDRLREVWGDEGVTRTVADRVKAATEGWLKL